MQRLVILNTQVIAIEHPTIAQQWLIKPLFQLGELESVELFKPSRKAMQDIGDAMEAELPKLSFSQVIKVDCTIVNGANKLIQIVPLGDVGGYACLALHVGRLIQLVVSDMKDGVTYDPAGSRVVGKRMKDRIATAEGQASLVAKFAQAAYPDAVLVK